MSVYIPGMEMPKDIEPGLVIEFADGIDGKRYARLYHYRHGGLTEWCEAVPVPPHGRLGDLDALKARATKRLYASNHGSMAEAYYAALIDLIDAEPAVIPADTGG